MSDVQKLLDEAHLPWSVGSDGYLNDRDGDPIHWDLEGLGATWGDEADAALIVYAVNNLPAYEALREAGEHLVELGPNPTVWRELHEALRRLREGVPA